MANRRRCRHSKLKMKIWDFLNEVGSANTHEIIEYLKDSESTKTRKYVYGKGEREGVYVYGSKRGSSFTTNQVTQILAKNKFFRKIGEERSERRTVPEGHTLKVYSRYTTPIPVYEAVSIEELALSYRDTTRHRMSTLEQLPKRMADAIQERLNFISLDEEGNI